MLARIIADVSGVHAELLVNKRIKKKNRIKFDKTFVNFTTSESSAF